MADKNAPLTLALTIDGDLAISASSPSIYFLSGLDAVTQQISIAIRLWKGNWFLDLDLGIDWLGKILGQKPNPRTVASLFRERILGIEHVISVPDIAVTFEGPTRTLKVTFNVLTEFGLLEGLEA